MNYIVRWATTKKDPLDQYGEEFVIQDREFLITKAWNRQRVFSDLKGALRFIGNDKSGDAYYVYDEFMRFIDKYRRDSKGHPVRWKSLSDSDKDYWVERDFPEKSLRTFLEDAEGLEK